MTTRQGQQIAADYEQYVKGCMRTGKQILTPNEWLAIQDAVDQFRPAQLERITAEPKLKVATEPQPQANEAEVRAKFTQLMIDEGINNSMSLAQRAHHHMTLGYDERPKTVKQTRPCELCGDILCAWAK